MTEQTTADVGAEINNLSETLKSTIGESGINVSVAFDAYATQKIATALTGIAVQLNNVAAAIRGESHSITGPPAGPDS